MKVSFFTSALSKFFAAFVITAMVLTIVPARRAFAATLTVTTASSLTAADGQCSLREAIINANNDAATQADCVAGTGNDTIVFNIASASPTITLAAALPTITDVDGLTINGTNLNAAGGTVTISGNNAVRIVSITGPSTLQNLILTNGAVDGNGGAINNTGNLTVNNVTFSSNQTITTNTRNGGAIFHNTGSLSITNSTFSGNSTQSSGGAIYIAGGVGPFSINGSTFTNNSALNGAGGAIFQPGGTTLTLGDSSGNTFSNNSALTGGGAIRQGGNITIGNSANSFSSNSSGASGGAMDVVSGTLTITNASFTSNSAVTGGAIHSFSPTLLTVTNSTFNGNSASDDGGAFYLNNTGSNISISGSTFTSNSAMDDAGAIYNDGAPFVVTTSTFQANTAGAGGAATGQSDGGAIRITSNSVSASSLISLSTFVGNSINMNGDFSVHGGAIVNDGTLSIANSTFSGNSLTKTTSGAGSTFGGAVYSNGNTTIHNVTFSGNSVSESGSGTASGGSIYASGVGILTIANSIVSGGTENSVPGNCGGPITNGGNNIDFNGGDCVFAITANPNLGSLTGSPSYFPLGSGSSAIDAGSNAICATATTTNNQSQNGVTRPQDGNNDGTLTCDIGSYEAPDTAPTVVSITRVDPNPTNLASVQFTVTFSEPVTGGDASNFALTTTGVSGASITNVSAGPGTTRTVTVDTGIGDGTIRLDMVNSTGVADGGGNAVSNVPFTSGETYTIDKTGPTVTIDQAAGQSDPTNTSPIDFTVVFSEAVTGFDATDISFAGSTVGGTLSAVVSGGPTTYTVSVSGMTSPGTVVASVVAGAVTDTLGNNSSASTSTDNTVTYDASAPTVTIDQAAGQNDPTNASPIDFTVVFSEPVTGFDAADLDFTGSTVGGALAATVTGGPSTYTVSISGMTSDGTIVVSVMAGAASDSTGNSSSASTSTDNVVTYDITSPTVAIDQAAGQSDPTSTSPIDFTVVFSEAVTGFDPTDISFSGSTAGGTLSAVISGGPSTYTVSVSGMSSPGTVVASVIAGGATDLAGNNNSASTSTDNTVTYDATTPTVTINQAAGQSDPTNNSPINFTVVFSETVTGFATGDVTLSGTAGATTATVTEIAPNDGTTYNVAVSGMTTDGTVIATIGAGVAVDITKNPNGASTSTDNTITYNTGLPDTTIDSNPPNPSNSANADFTFSSPDVDVVGFECQLDGGGFAACTTPLSYTSLSAGSHTFDVRAVDAANNVDPTPASYTWTIDLGFPTVAGSTPANNATITPGPIQITVTFSEDVKHDGSAGAANTLANYLLVEEGVNHAFDTVSCKAGPIADDTLMAIDTVTYNNNGGGGPYVATLNVNGGVRLPAGTYQLYVCGTTSIEDLSSNKLNNGLSDTLITFRVSASQSNPAKKPHTTVLPVTGFPMNQVTELPIQPSSKVYAATDLVLEIPSLGLKTSIVGVPQIKDGWDITWLNKSAGWLNGSAFPTWSGNSVLTGHVWDALNQPGPFVHLKDLKYGDQIKIHAFGQVYIFQVTESAQILPSDTTTVFKHADQPVLTLVTCEDYQTSSQTYASRRMVRAVLVRVLNEK